MRLKIFVLCGMVLLLLVFYSCTRVDVKTEAGTNVVEHVVFKGNGYNWVIVISKMTYLPNNPPGAVIKISNTLDRNLNLDFDGTSHYTVSIGDNSEFTLEVKEGCYKIMASAPGLIYVPENRKDCFSDRWVYSVRWKRKDIITTY